MIEDVLTAILLTITIIFLIVLMRFLYKTFKEEPSEPERYTDEFLFLIEYYGKFNEPIKTYERIYVSRETYVKTVGEVAHKLSTIIQNNQQKREAILGDIWLIDHNRKLLNK